jgi:hypothetical protein
MIIEYLVVKVQVVTKLINTRREIASHFHELKPCHCESPFMNHRFVTMKTVLHESKALSTSLDFKILCVTP